MTEVVVWSNKTVSQYNGSVSKFYLPQKPSNFGKGFLISPNNTCPSPRIKTKLALGAAMAWVLTTQIFKHMEAVICGYRPPEQIVSIVFCWFLSFSGKNDAESLCHFVKIPFLDPKCTKSDENSDFSHVRTHSWLHKLRNTRGKTYFT